MDSPVRKALKRNDYQRHKLFRKMKRLRENRRKQEMQVAEKELKRKLRRPKFDEGSDDKKYKNVAPQYRSDNSVANKPGYIISADPETNTAIWRNNFGEANRFYPRMDVQMNPNKNDTFNFIEMTRAGYTPKEIEQLENAYQFPESTFKRLPSISSIKEKGATNAEIVSRISKDFNGATGEELNAIIKQMPRSKVEEYLNTTNGYSRDFKKNKTDKWYNDVKDSWIAVAGGLPFIVQNDSTSYVRGKDLKRPKFQKGTDDKYYDYMERLAKKMSKEWNMSEEDALTQMLNDNEYNYRAFYDADPKYAEDFLKSKKGTHFTDVGKTVYHPTFSNESKYSGVKSDYNPYGLVGGNWYKDSYRLSNDQFASGWNLNKTRQYLDRAESNPIKIKTPYDPYEITERTYPGGQVRYFDEENNELTPTTLGLVNDSGTVQYSTPNLTPFNDWKWQDTDRPELNARLRLAQYMQNAPARDIDKVMTGYLAAGIAPVAMNAAPGILTMSDAIGNSAAGQLATKILTNPIGKSMLYSTAGATGADIAAKAVTGKTFEEWGEQDLDLPWYLSGFVNPGGYLAPTQSVYNRYLNNLSRSTRSVLNQRQNDFNLKLSQNTASITPEQWTAAQDAAIARGDMAEAQRLRDLHLGERDNFEMNDIRYSPGSTNYTFTPSLYLTLLGLKKYLSGDRSVAERMVASKYGNQGSLYDKYPQSALNELTNTVIPRLKANRPWMSDREIDNLVLQNLRYGIYPAEMFDDAGLGDALGVHFRSNDGIAIRAGYGGTSERHVIPHEVRHRIDDALPSTELEDKVLADAYDNNFLEVNSHFGGKQYDASIERVTTNSDARAQLLGNVHLEKTPPHLQNKIIDKSSDELIFKAVENANGYGRAFIKRLRRRGLLTHEKAELFREAMKVVPVALPFAVAAYNTGQYNSGKDIHIKPSKRGTFTAAAKKHGMGVQEYARKVLKAPKGRYSSAMRKKANFARNASRWNK